MSDYFPPPPPPPRGSSGVRSGDLAPTAAERREIRLRLVEAIAPRLLAHHSSARTVEETRRLVDRLEHIVLDKNLGSSR